MPLFVFISFYWKPISKGFMLLKHFELWDSSMFLLYGSIIPLLNPENSGWYLISLITWYIIFLLITTLVGKIVVQYDG